MPDYLTPEAKRQLIEARLQSFAMDAFGHELNRQVAVANGDDEAVATADKAIAAIAVATTTYQQELDGLPADIPQEP